MGMRITVANGTEITEELRQAIHAGALNGLEKGGLRGQGLVAGFSPVGASGNLARGVTHAITASEGNMTMEIFAGPPADVYAAPVNYGTRPHFPPVDALLLWVQKKLHVGNEQQAR